MVLNLSEPYKARRTLLLQYVSVAKYQLFRAYAAQDQNRIFKAKLSLARHLRELAESPELGPKPIFKPGELFYFFLNASADPDITAHDLQLCRGDYLAIANLLERELVHHRLPT